MLPAGHWVESSAKESAPQIRRYLSGRTSSVKDGSARIERRQRGVEGIALTADTAAC
jgi:hypothetical protein